MKVQNKTTQIIETLIEKEDFSATSENIQENIVLLKGLLKRAELNKLGGEVERSKTGLALLVKKELTQKNIHFLLGRYIGYIDALDEYLSIELRKKTLKDTINSFDISEIPHVNDIIVAVLKNEGIRHGKLAECVGIDKSTLTGLVDKLVDRGVITFSRPGKYKYYYLTELGRKYYEDNKIIIDSETNINALTEQLLLALSKEDDVNGKILTIIQKLTQGKHLFKGYKSKVEDRINTALIFAGIPKIEPINVMLPDTSLHKVDNALAIILSSEERAVCLFDSDSSLLNSNILDTNFSELLAQEIV